MTRERGLVLVTGSNGSIGRAVMRRFAYRFDEVVGFDRKAPTPPPPGCTAIPVDLTSDESVREGLAIIHAHHGARVASVVHLAAYYDFLGEPSPKYAEITVRGTGRLLHGLHELGFTVEQFVFSSTMLVHRPAEPGQFISEDWPLEPTWAYPESKVRTEQLIRADRGDIPAVLLRIAGVYDDDCHSIPLAHQIQRIYERRVTSRVYSGSTSHGQSFLHMDDLVDAIALAVERRAALPPELPLLVGEPETLSYDELQHTFARLIHDEDWETLEVPSALSPVAKAGAWVMERLPGGDSFIRPWMIDRANDHYALDITRARQLFGWQPKRSLRETLPKMVAALKADPLGFYQGNELEPPAHLRTRDDAPFEKASSDPDSVSRTGAVTEKPVAALGQTTSAVPPPEAADIGLIGLGVMGENLALNIANHGYRVALWTRSVGKVGRVIQQHGAGRQWLNPNTLEELTRSLIPPRRVLLMVKAGPPVDEMLEKLTPLLSPNDVVIDGGNSFFRDTERRVASLRARGLHFVGMGVSGGEEGARSGPSLMPGGAKPAYEVLRPMLEAIAAKTDSGPSVTYVGPDGAGHFVKMVHNGIEYGNMQLIAEAYDLLRKVVGLPARELSNLFAEWNRGPLESYLINITSRVLAARDPATGLPLVDLILDQAGQKGTGSWTVQTALELGVAIPTIAAAVDARILSSMRSDRLRASRTLAASRTDDFEGNRTELVDIIHDALFAATVCSFGQGMSLLRAASAAYHWSVNLREIARIWKGGCIIRARLLDAVMQAFERDPDLPNLLLDPDIATRVLKAERAWRWTVHTAVELGIPIPAMSASLAFFDSYRTASLPQNLTQALRDYFGAHTYQRADRPEDGFVHTEWEELIEQTLKSGIHEGRSFEGSMPRIGQ